MAMRKRWRTLLVGALLLGIPGACSRKTNTVMLVAPFDEDAKIGEVTATWTKTSAERAFSDATRLKEAQVRFQYRVDVRNRMGDKIFLRLGELQLIGTNGVVLGADGAAVECTLSAGGAGGILAGDVWVPKSAADAVGGFRVAHFAVPLNDLGRALYRKWLLEGRPGKDADVDAEIARYAAAAPCVMR